MGSFANTVFSILLGWIRTVVSIVWSALTDNDGESILQFIGKNWIMIASILCAAGLIVDFIIYLFRWEPYKVWKSFFRRLRNKKDEGKEEEPEPEYTIGEAGKPEQNRQYFRTAQPVRQAQEEMMYDEQEDLRRWQEEEIPEEAEKEPDEITRAGYSVPADSPYRRPESDVPDYVYEEEPERNRTRRRRTRLAGLLGDSDNDTDFHYYAPKPMIDQKDAYHAPVYPEKWKESRGQD